MAHRIDTAGYVIEGGKRRYINQNLPGTPGTIDTAEAQNMLMEEICNVVEMQGGTVASTAAEDRAAGWHQLNDTIFENGNITDAAIESTLLSAITNGTAPGQSSTEDLCAGLVDFQIASPALPPNILNTAGTIRDSCLGWDTETDRPHLWVLFTTGAIHRVTGLWGESTPALSASVVPAYTSTPDNVYALCADSSGLYVVWGVTAGNFQVSKFTTSSLSVFTLAHVWTIDTGYPCALSATGETVRIITATSGKLAVLLPGNLAGVSARAIGIIVKSSGAAIYGTGSYVDGYGDSFYAQNAKVVSDGTHVYWVQYNSSAPNSVYFLMSAAISDPSTSSYASRNMGTFVTADAYTHPRGIVKVPGGVGISSPDGKFRMFTTSDEDLKDMFLIDNFAAYGAALPDSDAIIASDGLNAWCLLIRLDSPTTQDTIVAKVPLTYFAQRGELGFSTEVPFSRVHIDRDVHVADYSFGKLIFDRINMILVCRNGYIMRIVNAGLR